MKLSSLEIKIFQNKILSWYEKNKRALPWRNMPVETSLEQRAYRVLISEVMSQQTQINRVVPKFENWMQKFPTVQTLANAKVSDVLQYWSGLGYNRRALNLKKLAEQIVKDYDGIFPQDETQLLQLPGIGKYTARAILCFAFGKEVAMVDTNIRKIIITQFGFDGNEKELYVVAEKLLPKGKAYEWNQALMDYAAVILKKEKIKIPKQSKFVGSHRYYRGQILKKLLDKKIIAIKDLGKLIKKDFTSHEKEWLEKLLNELIAEGFIVKKNNTIQLVS